MSTPQEQEPRGSDESQRDAAPTAEVLFDYLPPTTDAYSAVEKRLVRRIDWALMPVLIAMIVLK